MADDKKNKQKVSLNRLVLMITIVRKKKADYYADYIQSFGVNYQVKFLADGTADGTLIDMLGLDNTEKIAIFSFIRAENAKKALAGLEEKFASIRGGKGVAFTVPMSSIVSARAFGFLSDNRDLAGEEA